MDYGGGDKYVGEWRRGKEHGAGQLYKKGVATAATYYNGVLQANAAPPLAMGNPAVGKEKVAGLPAGRLRERLRRAGVGGRQPLRGWLPVRAV